LSQPIDEKISLLKELMNPKNKPQVKIAHIKFR
jgi:hypothetical protein